MGWVLSLVDLAYTKGNLGLLLGPNVKHYEVSALPNVTFPLPLSWAGQIHIPDTKDDELFFWLFEAETPSNNLISKSPPKDISWPAKIDVVVTCPRLINKYNLVWLNGGPGCSSLGGLAKEHGPLQFVGDGSLPTRNPYSFTRLANVLYVDQPVGTGFSDGSVSANDNEEVTQDFYRWLTAFYKEFPRLASLDTYLMGESYAGIYVCFAIYIDSHSMRWQAHTRKSSQIIRHIC